MCHIERAREAAKSGYALSELINAPGFFFVHRPDGTKYLTTLETCDCPACTVCKHIGIVEIACRYVATLERKARKPRRRFSVKHIEALRNLHPIMAGPAAPAAPAFVLSPEALALRERVAERMKRDFPV